jgi:hypothetical protein
VAAIYGEAFVPVLREPTSVLVADGSPVVVRRGVRLRMGQFNEPHLFSVRATPRER